MAPSRFLNSTLRYKVINTEAEKWGHRSQTPAFFVLIWYNQWCFWNPIKYYLFLSVLIFLTLFQDFSTVSLESLYVQVFPGSGAEDPHTKMLRKTSTISWWLWELLSCHFHCSKDFFRDNNKKRRTLKGKLLFKQAFKNCFYLIKFFSPCKSFQ